MQHSTNMIWPWSYDKCNRDLQLAQEVNHCAKTRHWDLHANQGRYVFFLSCAFFSENRIVHLGHMQ